MKKQCRENSQVEIMGIAASALDNGLEETLWKIIDKAGMKINDGDIEFCDSVGNQDRTIVTLSHRKGCQQLMKIEKVLLNLIWQI